MELFTESSLPAPARPTVIPRLWHLRTPRGPAWTSSVGMPRVSSVWIANQWSTYPMVYQLVNYQQNLDIPRLWHLPNDQIIGLNKSRQKVLKNSDGKSTSLAQMIHFGSLGEPTSERSRKIASGCCRRPSLGMGIMGYQWLTSEKLGEMIVNWYQW